MTNTITINGKTIEQIEAAIKGRTGRSAWSRGVEKYSVDLLHELAENVSGGYVNLPVDRDGLRSSLKSAMLNGATSWAQYSYSGCALIYDGDIAERLCTPSELKKTGSGERRPNSREEWLDVQARALSQAADRVFWSILK